VELVEGQGVRDHLVRVDGTGIQDVDRGAVTVENAIVPMIVNTLL
jgi:hypothetical protein